MLPYTLMICMVAILGGILNVHRHFAAPAAAPILLNIFIIAAVLATGWAFNAPAKSQVFYVASAVLLAGISQIALQFVPLRLLKVTLKAHWDVHSDAFKKIIILMAPMILGLTVTQINTLFDDLIAWWFSGSEEKGQFLYLFSSKISFPLWRGSVSHLYYSQRLYQFPLGVFGISLATAIFPLMSSFAAKKDFASLAKTVAQGLRSVIFIALPATVGLIMIARPLVSVIFEHGDKFSPLDTGKTAYTLSFYALGLCGFFAQQILTRAFFSMQNSKVPAKTACIAVAVNIILNLTLIWFLQTAGLALSTAICSYIQVVILAIVIRKILGDGITKGLSSAILKTIIATVIMAAVLLGVLLITRYSSDFVTLLAVVPAGAISYFIAAKLLKIEMLGLLTGKKSINSH